MRVLYIVGCLNGESKRYRVSNYREYLSLAGVPTAAIFENEIPKRLRWACSFEVIVFFRAAVSKHLELLLAEGRKRGIPLVFDIDDLVFDPDAVGHVKAIRDWPPRQVEKYLDGVKRYRKTLEKCDYVTVPTNFLADYIRRVAGKHSFVLRNGLNALQINLSARAAAGRQPHGHVTIGYFSGTKTHSADFAQIIKPLTRILADFPQTRLLIAGCLDVPEELRRFGARVEKAELVDWRRLPAVMARADINLAPLETGNPYCEAKSELKYFEAAVAGVPTVASPTDAFRWAIRHGNNGFLAKTPVEWYDALAKLIRDPQLRFRTAQAARRHALSAYAPEKLSRQALTVYKAVIACSKAANLAKNAKPNVKKTGKG